MNSIKRDVFVKEKKIPWEIPYTRNTNAQTLQFRICDFTIPENAQAQVYVQKPSGKAVFNNAVIDGNIVMVNVDTQMFSEVGNCELQLRISKGEDVLVTFNQPVRVYPNYTEGDAEASRNESGFFGEYEAKVNDAVEKANKAAGNANKKAEELQRSADNGEFTGSIRIGSVNTGEEGSEAYVENTGTGKDAVLDITIPRGDRGASIRMRGKWTPETEYISDTEYIDITVYEGSSYACMRTHTSSEGTRPDRAGEEYWLCIAEKGKTGNVENISTVEITFQKAAEMANIESGDSIGTALGKLAKLYEELEKGKTEYWSLSCGTEIAENADLNASEYLEIGNYYCPTTSAAETLFNCPVRNAFTMKVELNADISIVRQTIRPYNTGDVYVRILSNDGSSLILDWTLIAADQSKKVDASKIVESTEITEPGFLMDGKTASEKFSEVDDGLTGKQNKITGGATTIVSSNLTASRALVSNSSGKVEASSVTSKQLGYLSGATGNIQNQINDKNYLKDKGGDNTITFDWTSSGLEVYIDSTKIGAVQIV